jgi:hypothetical protein
MILHFLFILSVVWASIPESSGLIVEMSYEGDIYFNNRSFTVQDKGVFPDKRSGDGVYSCFVSIQSTSVQELSIFQSNTKVLHYSIPAISSVEYYVLRIQNDQKTTLKRQYLVTEKENYTIFFHQDKISIMFYFVLIGIWIHFQIRKIDDTRKLTSTLIERNPIQSQVIVQSNTELIKETIFQLTQHTYVIIVDESFDDVFQKSVFGRCFFVNNVDLENLYDSIADHHILEEPVLIFPHISSIFGKDRDGNEEILLQIFHEYPQNIIVFTEEQKFSSFQIQPS